MSEEEKVKEFAIKNAGKKAKGRFPGVGFLIGRVLGYKDLTILLENEASVDVIGSETKVAPYTNSAGLRILVSGKRKASMAFQLSEVSLVEDSDQTITFTTSPADSKKAPEEKTVKFASTACHPQCVYGFCHLKYMYQPILRGGSK